MYFWSISKAAKFAKEQTAKAASIKAWRITTRAGKALQEIARQMAAGKGYEIATDAEIFAKYGELCPIFKVAKVRDNKPRIWCIYTGVAETQFFRYLFNWWVRVSWGALLWYILSVLFSFWLSWSA